jgi:murein DD-endopeptidase MepM/ murein hydrolase activator NlpD
MLLALVLAAGVLAATPAFADTKHELDTARQQLAAAQSRLAQATAVWQSAEARLFQLRDDIAQTRTRIGQREATIQRLQQRLQRRAVTAFEAGPASTIDLLLSSGSFTEFSDRMEFLGSVAQGDSDLVVETETEREALERDRADLASSIEKQSAETQRYEQARAAIAAETAKLNSVVADLAARYRKEQQAVQAITQVLGQSSNVGGAIQRCPVAGPNSFVDSFGWPRPGGRTHQGIDLISPYGTPVVAVQPGRAVATPNTLGGNAVIVYGSGGDWTYYAHLSSYGTLGSVSVGTVIGHVGSTGDTNVNHLHFEYHPGGGAAVDPYQMLLQVC